MDTWAAQRRQAALEHLEQSGWLQQVQWLEEIDSTNSLARRMLVAGQLPLPALLVADSQTAGRGRAARSWWSPSGCLMLSLVLGPDSMPSDSSTWPQLSLITGVAAASAVEAEVGNVSVQLKWPNDLYVQQRKLAGILVEALPLATGETDQAPAMALVVGIGINVAVDLRDAPADVQLRACSLSQFSSVPLTLESVLVSFVEQMQSHLAQWQAGESDWWQRWSQRSLLSGRTVQAQLPGGQLLIGQCEGIDPSGALVLRDALECHRIQSADILRWE